MVRMKCYADPYSPVVYVGHWPYEGSGESFRLTAWDWFRSRVRRRWRSRPASPLRRPSSLED